MKIKMGKCYLDNILKINFKKINIKIHLFNFLNYQKDLKKIHQIWIVEDKVLQVIIEVFS